MSNIVYLTVTGEQQGSISAGCGTSESTGNRWQSGHEDETFTFSLLNNINNTGLGSQGNDSNLLIVFYVQIMPDD
ncbi:hypothetical protein FSH62_007190, partial [Escherichia coli]|nr:hypothetical protein [Escherichia coli]